MNIVVDLSSISEFFSLPPETMLWRFMAYYGWIIIALMYLYFAKEMWLIKVQTDYCKKIKHILLAIDIPRANEQSPRAVENMLAYLAGAHGTINWFEKYWEGKCQQYFSFEIVSIDGYTQFIIRTPLDFRYLVESAVYPRIRMLKFLRLTTIPRACPENSPMKNMMSGAQSLFK
jgi:hypothetical protein